MILVEAWLSLVLFFQIEVVRDQQSWEEGFEDLFVVMSLKKGVGQLNPLLVVS